MENMQDMDSHHKWNERRREEQRKAILKEIAWKKKAEVNELLRNTFPSNNPKHHE